MVTVLAAERPIQGTSRITVLQRLDRFQAQLASYPLDNGDSFLSGNAACA